MVKKIIFQEFLKQNLWKYILGIGCIIVTNILQIAIPKLLGYIIDSLKYNTAAQSTLFLLTLGMFGIAVAVFGLRFLWRYLIIGAARDLECLLRERFFQHLQRLPVQFFNNRKTGELMAYAINDLQAIRMGFAFGLVGLLQGVTINLFSVFIMAKTIHFKLTVIALIPILFSIIIIATLRPLIQVKFKRVQEKFADISDKVQENLSGIRVVKGYLQEQKEIEKLKKVSRIRMDAQMEYISLSALYEPAIHVFFGISFSLNLMIGSTYVVNGIISLGDFIAFNSYIAMISFPVARMGRVIVQWQSTLASIKRVDEILMTKPDIFDENPIPVERRFTGDITIKNLNFRYPGEISPTLNDVNIQLKAGKTLAIIGDTGSGKTTLVNLLLRLFRVNRGHIFIDDIDINDIPLAALRENIGYAPQDSFLFSTSIKENIAFFKAVYDLQDIEEAARQSSVYKNIVDFPDGFDTILGERGVTLSGGQKQRISIARAIIKDPSILILDDSFSAVDTKTEEEILNNLQKVMDGRTGIIIAHRVSTIKYADEIIVLEQGRIVERGTHRQLVKKQGKYYGIYLSQLTEDQL